jgi:predicted Zn-dependent peptidase
LNGITGYRLDNGMTIISRRTVRPGGGGERMGEAGEHLRDGGEYGLAHVHEHMVSRVPGKRAVGEMARL